MAIKMLCVGFSWYTCMCTFRRKQTVVGAVIDPAVWPCGVFTCAAERHSCNILWDAQKHSYKLRIRCVDVLLLLYDACKC